MNQPNEQLQHLRHTLAHLLAAAVLELYPDTKPTIGPAIDTGFYYDFEFKTPITDKDLKDIEKKMRKLLPSWKDMSGKEVSADEARSTFKDNQYKIELINDILAKNEKITLYTAGKFTDLCRGGHNENPAKDIPSDCFKLSRLAGAYWRGDEKNIQLTRIYGIAYANKTDLEVYENLVKEAEKRDHKKLGRELDLFTLSPLVGPGLPLLKPKGMAIRRQIEAYLWELHRDKGYEWVWTPHIAKEELYVTSGHAAKFGNELFRVTGKEEKFILKPMNCPHHMQIFADNQFSYRDMPVRYFEPATVYRDEKSGQLGGLTRVRAITQDDGHLFCRVSQIQQEVSTIVAIIRQFYTTMNLMNEYWVSLSVRGEDRSKYLGTDEAWEKAEGALEQAAIANNLNYKKVIGEAAFYGPKLDFMFKDAIGREWQLATIQCDFNLPERFDLFFTNEKSEKERPVVIHRAISGSLERFMGILIEHYSGNFPLWLAPSQVAVIPVGEAHFTEAQKVHDLLRGVMIRSEIDLSNNGFGKKIRNAKNARTPYTIIIGDKDMEAKKVTLESRDLAAQTGKGQIGQLDASEVLKKLVEEINERK